MTTIKLSQADLAALHEGKIIERVGGPTIKIMLNNVNELSAKDVKFMRERVTDQFGGPKEVDAVTPSKPGIDIVKVLVEPEEETPFDGERVKGRKFTPEEIEERKKFFGRLFGCGQNENDEEQDSNEQINDGLDRLYGEPTAEVNSALMPARPHKCVGTCGVCMKVIVRPEGCEQSSGGCYRAGKLEKRLAEFYYTKEQIDERMKAILDFVDDKANKKSQWHMKIEALRKRFT